MSFSELEMSIGKFESLSNDILHYFVIDTLSWDVACCPNSEQAEQIADQLNQLYTLIIEHEEVSRAKGTTYSAELERRAQLDTYFAQIQDLKDTITLYFMEWSESVSAETSANPGAEDGGIGGRVEPTSFESPGPFTRAQELARTLDSEIDSWDSFFWAMLVEDDLAGAYWLSRSLQHSGIAAPLPDWLLAAVQGSQWLSSAADEILIQNLVEIAPDYEPQTKLEWLFGLSASILPILVAPQSGLLGWLQTPGQYAGLTDLAQAIARFTGRYGILTPQSLIQAADNQQREVLIAEKADEARSWLTRAPTRRIHSYARASHVWRELFSSSGALYEFLLPIANDNRGDVRWVRNRLEVLRQPSEVNRLIFQADAQLTAAYKTNPIQGSALNALIANFQKSCELAEEWCSLVEENQRTRTGLDHSVQQIQQLRSNVCMAIPALQETLARLGSELPGLPWAAATHYLKRSVSRVCQKLALSDPWASSIREWDPWQWLRQGQVTLQDALDQRLLMLPTVALGDAGEPVSLDRSIAEALQVAYAKTDPTSIPQALEGWFDRQDYRFVEYLLEVLGGQDAPQAKEYHKLYLESKKKASSELGARLESTEKEIELALLDGVIGDATRAEYLDVVVQTKPHQVLDFPRAQKSLADILELVSSATTTRIAHLQAIWDELKPRLDPYDAAHQALGEQIVKALEAPDPRQADQLLAQLRNALGGRAELTEPIIGAENPILDLFHEQYPRIEQTLTSTGGLSRFYTELIQAIQYRDHFGGLDFGGLNRPRQIQAIQALGAWVNLRKHSNEMAYRNLADIKIILEFVGFTLGARGQAATLEYKAGRDNWLLFTGEIQSSQEAVRPIAQFGSEADKTYDIVCVWGRPTPSLLSTWISDCQLDSRNVLVIYLGWFTWNERQAWRREAIRLRLNALLLDEILLTYLTLVTDHLKYFFKCAIPFTGIIPYTPYRAGYVAAEMFYGRAAEIASVRDWDGNCIIYGGRQLGKSALLVQVLRQVDRPAREQYACLIDIKLVGNPDGPPMDAIGRLLREELQKTGLFTSRHTSDRVETVIRNIQEKLDEDPERRLLIMFDEADAFLDADSRQAFNHVEKLRKLMNDSGRRCKVVFAGLHNVQRFYSMPNQPLAHFGKAICIGPLDGEGAHKLISEPLEALGYQIDKANILRIFSYTNSHPGLIQHFCYELINALHKRPDIQVPYRVTRRDVESVYLMEHVRDRIRERLDWTLALDDRYQAIAWALIVDQMTIRDSFARAYTPGEVLHMMRSYWPARFADDNNLAIQSILEEMDGLGVLIRNADQTYRLRNPNLVRLMGTERQIEDRLLDLVSKPTQTETFAADDYHFPLDTRGRIYSPLTNRQDRTLSRNRYGVSLVFASEAQGYAQLHAAFSRYIQDSYGTPQPPVVLHHSAIHSVKTFTQWLDSFLNREEHDRDFIVLIPAEMLATQNMVACVEQAQAFVRERQRGVQHRGRILFLFNAQDTRTWLKITPEIREKIELQVDTVAFALRWNAVGVRQRLEQTQRIASGDFCQKVLRMTGGWHSLLDSLFDRCEQDPDLDISQALNEMEEELATPGSALAARFWQETGIVDEARRVLKLIYDMGSVPLGEDLHELVEGAPPLTAEEYRQTLIFLQRMGVLVEHVRQGQEGQPYSVEVSIEPVVASLLKYFIDS